MSIKNGFCHGKDFLKKVSFNLSSFPQNDFFFKSYLFGGKVVQAME